MPLATNVFPMKPRRYVEQEIIPQSSNAQRLEESRQLIAHKEELYKVFENIYSQEAGAMQY